MNILDEDTEPNEVSMDELIESHKTIDEIRASPDFDEEPTGFSPATVPIKYRTEAQVPKTQRNFFDQYQGAYGRHVALSNTKRIDNPRHLNALDLQYLYDRIPTLRHRGNEIRVRETSEYQMCRSNQEMGGFEAKLGVTNIRRENVDVKQAQSLFSSESGKKKRRGMLSFLRR